MPESLLHTAFYRFVRLDDVPATMTVLHELTAALTGSILLAEEGINGVAAGTPDAVAAFEQAIQQDPRLNGAFTGMAFKHSQCTTPPFARMKIYRKPEIVAVGVPAEREGETVVPHNALSPQQWRELIAQDDVVVLDNRNSFEFKLGRFKGAVDPGVQHFRDFPRYVEAHAQQWRDEGKRVAMYCTGGIRCEKTSAWMERLGLPVFQLDGGILNYFQQLPDAEKDWEGECFVFDNRIALDTHLTETATTAEDVYKNEPDGEWRLARARRLDDAAS